MMEAEASVTERGCFLCDEGMNGDIPCPQCNTAAWNAYHEQHKEIVTVVERRDCDHEKTLVSGTVRRVGSDETLVYEGMQCEPCRSITWLRWLPQTTAETVE